MPEPSEHVLLSTAYFPPVQYFSVIRRFRNILIEKHENYNKQTYRNRAVILTANGVMPLVIPVKRLRGAKTIISQVRTDNSCNWQKLHRISIESAYRSSPFFDYYFDELEPCFRKKYNFLIDLNTDILDKLIYLLNMQVRLVFTSRYIEPVPVGILDMRDKIHPKKREEDRPDMFEAGEYYQVFGNRHGFRPNLSILDLIFNVGPDALPYLDQCRTFTGTPSFIQKNPASGQQGKGKIL